METKLEQIAVQAVNQLPPASQGTENSTWAGHEAGLRARFTLSWTPMACLCNLPYPGEAHDNRLCPELLTGCSRNQCCWQIAGYDADWLRTLVNQQGAWANIPPKRNRKEPICFSAYLYRARNLVERFFNKIKQCRRIAIRYDKLAANYLAFIKLAAIRIWLRSYESAP
jgi:transposase